MSELTLEDILIFEGHDYQETAGARGRQLNIRECPVCGNDSWKVYANAETALGNCFAGSCGRTFNLFKYAKWILEGRRGPGVSSVDVGKYLNDIRRKLGYRPKSRKIATPPVAVTEDLELPTSAALPYEDGWNHPYLEGRGVDGSYAARYRLRYSPFGSHLYKDEKGQPVTQSFAERILIPVYDLDGKLVTFQGRDTTGTSDKRYKFAGGLPGTGRYIYQGHVALARHAQHVVMSEGFMDVIGVQKAIDGDPDMDGMIAVGSWGKHLTQSTEGDDQVGAFARLKREGLKVVTVLYDPEPEAYDEALKAAAALTKIGLEARVGMLPAGKDPGEADAIIIRSAIKGATAYNRMSALRLRMNNPYAS